MSPGFRVEASTGLVYGDTVVRGPSMSDVLHLIETAIAEDRAVYEAAGIVKTLRCYWCRDEFDPAVHQPRRTRDGFVFDSDACRRAWHRAAVRQEQRVSQAANGETWGHV